MGPAQLHGPNVPVVREASGFPLRGSTVRCEVACPADLWHVDADEGRLERIGRERLDRALVGVPFRYERADSLQPDTTTLAGVPLAGPLLLALAALLVGEQLLAYSASYHGGFRGRPRG